MTTKNDLPPPSQGRNKPGVYISDNGDGLDTTSVSLFTTKGGTEARVYISTVDFTCWLHLDKGHALQLAANLIAAANELGD